MPCGVFICCCPGCASPTNTTATPPLVRVPRNGRAPLPPIYPPFHPFNIAFPLPRQLFSITKWLQLNKTIIKMARFIYVARSTFRYIVAVLLFLALIPVLWSFFPTRLQPRQPDEPTRQMFGIGFDLAVSYRCVDLLLYRSRLISTRTVAISYLNSTVWSIAKVEGDAVYIEIMSRLSLLSSRHLQYTSFYSIR